VACQARISACHALIVQARSDNSATSTPSAQRSKRSRRPRPPACRPRPGRRAAVPWSSPSRSCPWTACSGGWPPAPARASSTAALPPLILLLVDLGPRRAELMVLKLADLDFDLEVLLVLGKGRRERAWVPANPVWLWAPCNDLAGLSAYLQRTSRQPGRVPLGKAQVPSAWRVRQATPGKEKE
jgi:hypothetical protein